MMTRLGLKRVVLLGMVGLLTTTACGPWADGCDAQPLDEPLEPMSIGPRAVEFYLPADRVADLGAELLEDLAAGDADRLEVELPAISAVLDLDWEVVSDPIRLAFSVARLEVTTSQGGLLLEVELEPIDVGVALSLFELEQPAGECSATLVIPARVAGLPLVLAETDDGQAALQVDGNPRFTGPELSISLGNACPVNGLGDFQGDLGAALDAGLQDALPLLSDALVEVCSKTLGANQGNAGQLGDSFRYWLSADTGSTALALEGSRLGLAGGFETARDACVPLDLGPAAPAHGAPAPFTDVLPESQEPYGLGVAISRAYLEQALASAHRAGLLCRRSGAGDLIGVDLAGGLPSLGDLGQVDAVRAAVWPQGELKVTFGPADTEAGERLPRLLISLPELYLDVYARLDGADLRVLGIRGDVTLAVAGRLTGHELTLSLADAQVTGLEIEFAELVTEQAGDLRAAARDIVYAVGSSLIDQLPAIPLGLPSSAGPELLEVRQSGEHVILYF